MTTPSGTEWGQYGLADIWDMVRDDNYDNFSHVKAWKKMAELCHGMAGSLTTAAAELGHRWPPEQSPAAAAFKERLDELANKFTQAAQAAGANGPTLAEVNRGFAISRGKIVELCRSWQQMERAEAARVTIARRVLPTDAYGASGGLAGAFTGAVQGGLAGGLPGAVSGAFVGGAAAYEAAMSDRQVLALSNMAPAKYAVDAAGGPDVSSNWRQQFDSQARAVMAATDGEIIDAQSRIQNSPVVVPRYVHAEPPPDPHVRIPGGSGGSRAGGFTPPPTPTIPPGFPERSPTLDGPILDGGARPGPSGQFWNGGSPAPPAGGQVPWVITPTGPALAPGAVIGERPPAARAPFGAVPGGAMPMGAAPVRPGGGAANSGFVAPPGGLIGGPPIGRAPASTHGAAASRAARRRSVDDDDWVVPAGVPGVLRPDREPEAHDPGPGVIGIDR